MRSRPVEHRANLMAVSTVSAPELVKNTRSIPRGDRSTRALASSAGSRAQSSWTRLGRSASMAWCSASLITGWPGPGRTRRTRRGSRGTGRPGRRSGRSPRLPRTAVEPQVFSTLTNCGFMNCECRSKLWPWWSAIRAARSNATFTLRSGRWGADRIVVARRTAPIAGGSIGRPPLSPSPADRSPSGSPTIARVCGLIAGGTPRRIPRPAVGRPGPRRWAGRRPASASSPTARPSR
jgi:hypothetical protein